MDHSGHPGADKLAAYALHHLEEPERNTLHNHLLGCGICRSLLEYLPQNAIVSLSATRVPLSEGPAAQLPPARPTAETAAFYTNIAVEGIGALEPIRPPGIAPPALLSHPRYRLLSFLGAGGMGVVYKAEHRLMERIVAIKTIHPRLVDRPEMVERFQREVRAAARLQHPNIVAAFDAEQAGDTHFLVMEYVEGPDLEQVATCTGQLPVRLACDYALQIAHGLQHAFEKNMVHRDIKPHNVMVTPAGQVKILDFGLARFVSERSLSLDETAATNPAWDGLTKVPTATDTGVGWVLGTADYIAPEEAEDARRADIRADLYSLGCVLYRMLAGQVPFPGGTAEDKVKAHFERMPAPLGSLRPDVPAILVDVVNRLIAKDRRKRYQTPQEAIAALACFTA